MKKRVSLFFIDFLLINLGLILTAFSVIGFLLPAKLAAGGVSGIATITWYLFQIPIGTMMLIINIPLFIAGVKIFGREYGLKGIYGIIMLSVYCHLLELSSWILPLQEVAARNLLISTVYGGVIGGIGMGLVMSLGSNTGGTDITAQIFNRYFDIPLGTSLIIVDLLIILSSAITFGIEVMLYAYICLYLTGKMINIIEGYMKDHYHPERFFLLLTKVAKKA